MNPAYGPLYQQLRKERLELADHQCELAIHGRHVCKGYRLECHHKDKQSYVNCETGLANANDLIILCEYCHDVVTNFQRMQRFSGRAYSVPTQPEEQGRVRYGLEYAKVSVGRCSTSSDEERSHRRSAESVRKGIEGD